MEFQISEFDSRGVKSKRGESLSVTTKADARGCRKRFCAQYKQCGVISIGDTYITIGRGCLGIVVPDDTAEGAIVGV